MITFYLQSSNPALKQEYEHTTFFLSLPPCLLPVSTKVGISQQRMEVPFLMPLPVWTLLVDAIAPLLSPRVFLPCGIKPWCLKWPCLVTLMIPKFSGKKSTLESSLSFMTKTWLVWLPPFLCFLLFVCLLACLLACLFDNFLVFFPFPFCLLVFCLVVCLFSQFRWWWLHGKIHRLSRF